MLHATDKESNSYDPEPLGISIDSMALSLIAALPPGEVIEQITNPETGWGPYWAEFRSPATANGGKHMIRCALIIGAGVAGSCKRLKASACSRICRFQLAPAPVGSSTPGREVIPTGCFREIR